MCVCVLVEGRVRPCMGTCMHLRRTLVKIVHVFLRQEKNTSDYFKDLVKFKKQHISVVTQPFLTSLCLFDYVSRV